MSGPDSAQGFMVSAADRERFALLVRKTSGCWLWTGATHSGYGTWAAPAIRRLGPLRAHRVAYAIAHGGVPAGLVVMHVCDNPICCRPDHLRAATQGENMRDSIAKGRWKPGTYGPTLPCPRCGVPRKTRRGVRMCRACHLDVNNDRVSAKKLAKRFERLDEQLAWLPSSYSSVVAIFGERNAKLFADHFGLYGSWGPKTLAALAGPLGVSRERARQLVARMCRKLGMTATTFFGDPKE